jgi:uncharacterized protein YbjT (DUF2867 family)
MKIVVIGGTGLIGSQVVARLTGEGHEAVAASPGTGVNAVTGEGLDAVLAGAEVVVDVSNSPSFAAADVLAFFETGGRNLLAAEVRAGVQHHVALSIVGADRAPESGYLRAKLVQEQLIEAGAVPFTIVRATQFFEFLRAIADGATEGDTVTLPTATLQPVAAAEVARFVADTATAPPVKGTVEIAGPEAIALDELVRAVLSADGDPRTVVGDPHGRYFGAELEDGTLTPAGEVQLGAVSFAEWLAADQRGDRTQG